MVIKAWPRWATTARPSVSFFEYGNQRAAVVAETYSIFRLATRAVPGAGRSAAGT